MQKSQRGSWALGVGRMVMVLRADMVTHSQLELVPTKKSTADPFPAPSQVPHLPTEKVGTHAQALEWLMAPFLLLRRGGLNRNREVASPASPTLLPRMALTLGGAHTSAWGGGAAMAGEGCVGLGWPWLQCSL